MDIGILSGAITLTNSASDVMKRVAGDVRSFSADVSSQVKSLAGQFEIDWQIAAVGVGKAIGAASILISGLVWTIAELGDRGSDINDVAATLDHFAGSADNAEKIMQNLRRGTLGTVDDFKLMQFSAKMLQAGVKTTADQFSTLSEAAFVLQNRGLGSTSQMLDTLSRAMVTGRTRALEMQIGVIDVTTAQRNLQKELGVDKLTNLQAAEAKRTAILQKMQQVVKEAGPQERDFGENMEYVKTQVSNFTDSLAQAIAASPAVNSAMSTMADAIGDAFGANQEETVKKLAYAIGEMAIAATKAAGFIVDSAMQIAKAYYSARTAVDTVFQMYKDAEIARVQKTLDALTMAPEEKGPSARKLRIQELRIELAKLKGESEGYNKDANDSAIASDKIAEAQKKAAAFMSDLTSKMRAAQEQGVKNSQGTVQLAKDQETAAGSTGALTKEQQRLQNELEKIREGLNGMAAIEKFEKMKEALGGTIDVSKLTAEGMKQVKAAADAATSAYIAQGRAVPPELQVINDKLKEQLSLQSSLDNMLKGLKIRYSDVSLTAGVRSFAGAVPKVNDPGSKGNMAGGIPGIVEGANWAALKATSKETMDSVAREAAATYEYARTHSSQYTQAAIDNFKRIAIEADRAAKGVTGSATRLGSELAQAIVGALQGGGNILASLAGMGGQKLGTHISEGISASLLGDGVGKFSKAFGGMLAGALPIIGSLAGPLMGKLWDSLFGTKGRDTKLQMAEDAFGSVKAMQDEMVTTLSKAQYDSLWAQFSKVGQNNKDQAIAAVNAIKDALEEAKKKQEEIGDAAEAAAKQQEELANTIKAKYKEQLDGLGSEYKTLNDSIAAEAEEANMGLVEQAERRRRDEVEQQMAAINAKQDAELEAAKETADQTADMIDQALKSRDFRVKVKVDLEGMPDFGHMPSGPVVGPTASVPSASGGGTAIINLDGRTLTEAVVPRIPGVVQEYGLA